MFNFLAMITNNKYWVIHSWIIKSVLKLYGIKVGRNFYIEGIPELKIKGKSSNIVIGNDVAILGDIDLRNRENGKIIIGDRVQIDGNCRFVAARDGMIMIKRESSIGCYAVFNGGADIIIGEKCSFASRISINSSEHEHKKGGQYP